MWLSRLAARPFLLRGVPRLPLVLCMLTLVAGLAWQAAREGSGPGHPTRPATVEAAGPPDGEGGPAPARPEASTDAAATSWPPAPPSKRARRLLAIADLRTLPALPEPGPSNRLAPHAEEGQSLAELLARARRDVTETRHTLRLQPLDDVAPLGVDVAVLAEHLRCYHGLPVTTAAPARPAELTTRTQSLTGRRRVLTTDVLRWLEGEVIRDLVRVLALTTEELHPQESWSLVLRVASLHRGVGVFSLARMDAAFPAPPPDPATRSASERARVLRRCLKVVTHEVGRMFALEHCIGRSCLMNGSNHAAEMDRTPLHLCPFCLRKVQRATRLDAAQRYTALAAFCRARGVDAEAAWVDALLQRVPE